MATIDKLRCRLTHLVLDQLGVASRPSADSRSCQANIRHAVGRQRHRENCRPLSFLGAQRPFRPQVGRRRPGYGLPDPPDGARVALGRCSVQHPQQCCQSLRPRCGPAYSVAQLPSNGAPLYSICRSFVPLPCRHTCSIISCQSCGGTSSRPRQYCTWLCLCKHAFT